MQTTYKFSKEYFPNLVFNKLWHSCLKHKHMCPLCLALSKTPENSVYLRKHSFQTCLPQNQSGRAFSDSVTSSLWTPASYCCGEPGGTRKPSQCLFGEPLYSNKQLSSKKKSWRCLFFSSEHLDRKKKTSGVIAPLDSATYSIRNGLEQYIVNTCSFFHQETSMHVWLWQHFQSNGLLGSAQSAMRIKLHILLMLFHSVNVLFVFIYLFETSSLYIV